MRRRNLQEILDQIHIYILYIIETVIIFNVKDETSRNRKKEEKKLVDIYLFFIIIYNGTSACNN